MRGRFVINHGKGDKQRFVWLPDSVLGLVEKWIAGGLRSSRARRCFARSASPSPGSISATSTSGRCCAGARRRCWAGSGRTGTGTRHGAAVDLALRDVALQDIQHALGHEHLSTTEVYLQGLMPMGVMAAGRSNNWLTA